ncbi:MAG: hypothetical protein M1152_05420 [Actinobacteria bacterium]|nr:hypothetical protein [Actinomycetota bacterium]
MSKDRSISKSDAITEKLHLRCFRSISTLVLRSIFILLFLSGSYYLQSTTVSNTVTSNTVTSNTVTSNTATAPYKPSAVAPHAVNSGTTLSTPGYGWNIQYVNSGIGLNSISCPTFLSCFAVGNYDTSNNAPVILQSSNSGSTWSSDTIPTANAPSVLSAVWCANGFNCWAVGYSTDNNGTTTVALFTTNGGASWSPQTIPSAVFSSWPISLKTIDCPTPDYCFAAGTENNGQGTPLILSTTNGGASWSPETVPISSFSPQSVSCPTSTTCWLSGTNGSPNNQQGVVLTTSNSGATWTVQTIPSAVGDIATVYCPTTGVCLAGGYLLNSTSIGGAVMLTTNDSGALWTETPLPSSVDAVYSISCPNSVDCWAMASSGVAGSLPISLATTDSGKSWSEIPLAQGVTSVSLYSSTSLSCPSTAFCWTVGTGNPSTSNSVQDSSSGVILSSNMSLELAQPALGPYTPLGSPTRICDTRPSNPSALTGAAVDCTGKTLSAGSVLNVQVSGVSGIPTSSISAVVANITVTNTTQSSYLSIWPEGTAQPTASNLNWVSGETKSVLVEVPLGPSGAISIYNYAGSVDVIVDVEGWVGPGSSPSGMYNPLGSPTRICDTRPSNPSALTGAAAACTGKTLSAGSVLNVQVSGVSGIPTGSIGAVVANITVTNTTQSSYLTVWPEGTAQPTASNLNWASGSTVSNLVVVPLSSSGSISIYNYSGSVDVIVDVEGWYTSSSSTSPSGTVFTSTSPTRICDTRPSNPSALTGAAAACTGKTLSAGSVLNVQVSGVSGIPTGSIGAVVVNITVTNTTQSSYLTVWPEGTAQPTASNLNWASGSTVSNLVVVPLSSSGAISIYNKSGSADVIVDVEGWYTTYLSNAYHRLAVPTRICDTRAGSGEPCAGDTLGKGPNPETLSVQVSGVSGIPTGSISAVVANITVTDTTQSSYLTAWPEGTAQPTASNLNWVSGKTKSVLVEIGLSSSGAISIYNYAGSVDVIVDVEGWVGPGSSPSGMYNPLGSPTRICDTRPSNPSALTGAAAACTGKTLSAGSVLNVQVSGVSGIPTGSIGAVVANITVTNTTQSSYLTVWPEGTAQPTASNLNWASGSTVSNLVVVPLSSSGSISIYNYSGSVDVIVDVEGWYTSSSSTSPSGTVFTSTSPTRICDTRPSNPSALTGAAAACTGKTLSTGSVLNVQVSGVSGIPTGSIGAVVANITVTDTTQSSYLTVWPEGTAQPTASNLNWASGSTVSNLVVVPLSSSGAISIYNKSGSADVIVDVEGWYG